MRKEELQKYTEKTEKFLIDHPEFDNFTAQLRGTYATCQASGLQGRPVDLQEAYEHIFVLGCKWCQDNFESKKEFLMEYLK